MGMPMDPAEQALRLMTPRVTPEEVSGVLLPFWRAVYGEESGHLSLTSGFRIGERLHGVVKRSFAWPDEGPAAVRWVARESSYGRDVYQRGHLVAGSGRRTADLLMSSLTADLNGAPAGDLPEPTVVVESSPGRRQCYWRLSEPVPAEVGKRLNARLRAAIGAASPGGDGGALLRPPGTLNFKYHDARVRLAQVSEVRYAAADLDRVLPPLPESPTGDRAVFAGLADSMSRAIRSTRVQAGLAAAAAFVVVIGGFSLRSVREAAHVVPGAPVASAIGGGGSGLRASEGPHVAAGAGAPAIEASPRTLTTGRPTGALPPRSGADPRTATPGGGGGSNPDAVSSTMSDAGHWVRTSYERAVHGIQGMS